MTNARTSSVIDRLVTTLESTLVLPTNSNWVELVGSGKEADNKAALRFWLENLLNNPDIKTGERLIPILLTRLEEILIENERETG
jgi:hypothetical protein